MNKRSRIFKALALLAMVILVAGMAFAVLHHHADGGHSFDCGACQLVKQLVLAFVLVFVSIFAGLEKRPEFVRVSETNPNSRVLSSPRKGRAPPASF